MPVDIEASAETRWSLTVDSLLSAHRRSPLAGVLIASPANPTGTMMTEPALAELVAAAEDAGIEVISDEIYHGLDYAFAAETVARLSRKAVVINSFSKYFCITGWQIGWLLVPEPLVRPIERLQQNLAISVPTLSKSPPKRLSRAMPNWQAIKRGYQANRQILLDGLPAAGLANFLPADGAFYLYANVAGFTDTVSSLPSRCSPRRSRCHARG